MQDEKGKIYYLMSHLQRQEAANQIRREIVKVDEQIHRVKQDMAVIQEAERDLDEILCMLRRMREISVLAARNPGEVTDKDRREFDNLRQRIDAIASGERGRWSQSEDHRIREIKGAVDSLKL